jgi:alkylation response protein AidB-like acyl-CoA dehydrogenase
MLTLDETGEEHAFRQSVRQWIASAVPPERRFPTDFAGRLELDRILAAAGYLGFTWPTEYGGKEASPILAAILYEELGAIGFVSTASPSHQGTNNIGPTIVAHGSDSQKAEFLPGIMQVRDVWCQGFSEPEAGSDLANVRASAAPGPDESWVLNGQKIWTTYAHEAGWIYVLARTGPPEARHRNLSMFLVPMSTEGITVRPIRQITDETEFDEVFFDDVHVPAANVLGEVGDGWQVAMTTLQSERLSGRHRYFRFRRDLRRLARDIDERKGAPAFDSWLIELGHRAAEIEAMRPLALRAESLAARGEPVGSLPSVAKLWWPVAWQELCELGQRVTSSTPDIEDDGRWYFEWLESRPASIYGGSAQVQRNIIAERTLGLPREPIDWRQLHHPLM